MAVLDGSVVGMRDLLAQWKRRKEEIDSLFTKLSSILGLDAPKSQVPTRLGRPRKARVSRAVKGKSGSLPEKIREVLRVGGPASLHDFEKHLGIKRSKIYQVLYVMAHRGEVDKIDVPGEDVTYDLVKQVAAVPATEKTATGNKTMANDQPLEIPPNVATILEKPKRKRGRPAKVAAPA